MNSFKCVVSSKVNKTYLNNELLKKFFSLCLITTLLVCRLKKIKKFLLNIKKNVRDVHFI